MASKHFIIQELVPPVIYNQFGEAAWQFVDNRLVALLDFIRDYFGKPMTVNNWDSGGVLTNRGFRMPDVTVGGKLSQHKFGRAGDFNINDMTPQQIYAQIMKFPAEFMAAGLTTVEDIAFTPTWNHVDNRWTGLSTIKIVKP